MKRSAPFPFVLLAWLLLFSAPARAQWLTQTIPLHPGWNAVYLHVSATNDTLENLVGAASPISEVWLWRPNQADGHLINSPLPLSGNDWVQWTKLSGPAHAFPLLANSAYLVRSASAYAWNLKGKPVPPESKWSASGLNFLGFSTRADSPPVFSNFLSPALSASPFEVFYYPGGEAANASPNTAPVFSLNTVPVTRGQAFWVRKQDNSDNRYFGPFEAVLQDYRGVAFYDSSGAYSLRLRNQTARTNTVLATLFDSEPSPAGETLATPPLLLRTALDSSTLKYSFTNLPVNEPRSFVLAPKGQPGSEMEVVIGLDRTRMNGTNGTPFAGILRLQDVTLGQLQIDLPVTATQASTEGLWVGNAFITQVGNYLKTYAKATNAVDFTNKLSQLTALNEANKSVSFPDSPWAAQGVDSSAGVATASVAANQHWQSIASSADGTRLAAAVNGGRIYTSADAGINWTARDTDRNWSSIASSADGTNLVASVLNGLLYTSTNSGASWTERESVRPWQSVACSTNGMRLFAVATGGQIYASTNAGVSWTAQESDRNWISIASGSGGTNLLAAVTGGRLYSSRDSGATWTERETDRDWRSVATSADGVNLVAAVAGGQIYTSTDAGTNWTARSTDLAWRSVASSLNGSNLVAAVLGGQLYSSTDAGTNWTARAADRDWQSVASSANGANLVAVVLDGRIYTSSDTGTNWNPISNGWSGVASSADGSQLVAAAKDGQIFTSINGGSTWLAQAGSPTNQWQAVASSSNGGRIVALVNGGQIFTSSDFGVNWAARDTNRAWSSVASSADGLNLVASVRGGDLYTSVDAGENWTPRTPLSSQNWQAVASSADGRNLLAAINGGQLYASTNWGVNWAALFGAPTANWQAVASSVDGKKLVAAASPGGIYTSVDAGVTWDLKASAPPSANWQAVASSTNGNVLVAVVNGGRIYTSTNSGANWTARDSSRSWSSVACSAAGTVLLAGEVGGAAQLYTLTGTLSTPSLVYDPNSNLILSDGAKYLTASFDTELGDVPTPLTLRVIVHQGSDGAAKLLQHVYVGPDALTTNAILARKESDLHPAFLGQARRISSVHLPLSNEGWPLKGAFGGFGIMNAVLTDGFDNQASNPFLHSYHPDHDNLDAQFQPILKPGAESYDIKRQVTLSFTPPGDDFASRTVGSSTVQGTYLENITLKGGDNQTRTVVTKGSFVLNRVSKIPTLK